MAGRAQLRRRGAGSRWALRKAGGLGPVGSASPGPIAASAAPDVGCPGNGGAGAGQAVGAGRRGPSPSPSCLGLFPRPISVSPAGPREAESAAAAGAERRESAVPPRPAAPRGVALRVRGPGPSPRCVRFPRSEITAVHAASGRPSPLRASRAFLA